MTDLPPDQLRLVDVEDKREGPLTLVRVHFEGKNDMDAFFEIAKPNLEVIDGYTWFKCA